MADACLLKALPSGAKAFVWEGSLYYESPYNETCPYGGWYDGANCYLQGAPAGSEPYAVGNGLLTPALCKPTTDWVHLQSSAAKVTVKTSANDVADTFHSAIVRMRTFARRPEWTIQHTDQRFSILSAFVGRRTGSVVVHRVCLRGRTELTRIVSNLVPSRLPRTARSPRALFPGARCPGDRCADG